MSKIFDTIRETEDELRRFERDYHDLRFVLEETSIQLKRLAQRSTIPSVKEELQELVRRLENVRIHGYESWRSSRPAITVEDI